MNVARIIRLLKEIAEIHGSNVDITKIDIEADYCLVSCQNSTPPNSLHALTPFKISIGRTRIDQPSQEDDSDIVVSTILVLGGTAQNEFYETVVFGRGYDSEQWTQHWRNLADALIGHEATVVRVQEEETRRRRE